MPKRVVGQPHRRGEANEYQALYRDKNREKLNAYYRDYHQRRKNDPAYAEGRKRSMHMARKKAKYGITRDDYDAMWTAQQGACAICGCNLRETRQVDTDHDHVTGEVRGLLCNGCNTGLGSFADCPERLEAAAQYIRTHKNP
jgi:hypothetical protein